MKCCMWTLKGFSLSQKSSKPTEQTGPGWIQTDNVHWSKSHCCEREQYSSYHLHWKKPWTQWKRSGKQLLVNQVCCQSLSLTSLCPECFHMISIRGEWEPLCQWSRGDKRHIQVKQKGHLGNRETEQWLPPHSCTGGCADCSSRSLFHVHKEYWHQ